MRKLIILFIYLVCFNNVTYCIRQSDGQEEDEPVPNDSQQQQEDEQQQQVQAESKQQEQVESQQVEEKDCPYVTSECDFKGIKQYICDEEPVLEDEIKSVYVPEGRQITLWDSTYFNGKTAVFEESVKCLEQVDYSNKYNLQMIGIKLLEKDAGILVTQNKNKKLRSNIKKQRKISIEN